MYLNKGPTALGEWKSACGESGILQRCSLVFAGRPPALIVCWVNGALKVPRRCLSLKGDCHGIPTSIRVHLQFFLALSLSLSLSSAFVPAFAYLDLAPPSGWRPSVCWVDLESVQLVRAMGDQCSCFTYVSEVFVQCHGYISGSVAMRLGAHCGKG